MAGRLAPQAARGAAPEAQPLVAAVWMTGAIGAFTAMAIAGRAVSFDHDTFEILLYRSVIGLGLVLLAGGLAGRLREITGRRLDIHLARNLCHFTGQNLWFFALPLIPLAQLFALEFTSPIWATLLAPLVLAEAITRRRLFAACLGFAGVLVVARPDFGALDPALLAALGAALGFAGSALFTRKLTRSETTLCILFWLTAMQTVLGLICAGLDGDIRLPAPGALPWLCVIAIAGLTAHFCMTTALALAPAGIVMPMDFARLPVIAVIGMLFYGEALHWAVILGAALIFAANWINIRRA